MVLTEKSIPSGTYNLGSGHSTYVAEIANMVYEYYSLAKPYDKSHIKGANEFYANLEKIRKHLGCYPETSLKEGIYKTLKLLDIKHGFN